MISSASIARPHQDAHRTRLLNRLGIYEAYQQKSENRNRKGQQQRQRRPIMTAAEQRKHQILRSRGGGYTIQPLPPADDGGGTTKRPPGIGVRYTKTNLNFDYSKLPTREREGTKIKFCETVDVALIPTRHEYSSRVKSRLWYNPHELHENMVRNKVEFAAEAWDWEKATEEESMYVCYVSGELIHPIHMQNMAYAYGPGYYY